MRDTYFLVMLLVGVVALIILGIFFEDWVTGIFAQIYAYWKGRGWLLSPAALLLEGAAAVGFFTFLIVAFFRSKYHPAGYNPSGTHEWVFQDTGRKFRDATELEMYERQHGPGSWQRKVEAEKRSFVYIGGLVVIAGLGGLIAWMESHAALPAVMWFWGLVTGLAFYILSALVFWLLGWIRDQYDFEETLTADLMHSTAAYLALTGAYLFVLFLYCLVFLFIPSPPAWMSTVYLGVHGVFAVFLVGMAVLWPFLPVMIRLKGG